MTAKCGLGEACPLPLAAGGGRKTEPRALRGDAESDRAAADRDGIERAGQKQKPTNRIVEEEVFEKWAGCGVTSPLMAGVMNRGKL